MNGAAVITCLPGGQQNVDTKGRFTQFILYIHERISKKKMNEVITGGTFVPLFGHQRQSTLFAALAFLFHAQQNTPGDEIGRRDIGTPKQVAE